MGMWVAKHYDVARSLVESEWTFTITLDETNKD